MIRYALFALGFFLAALASIMAGFTLHEPGLVLLAFPPAAAAVYAFGRARDSL